MMRRHHTQKGSAPIRLQDCGYEAPETEPCSLFGLSNAYHGWTKSCTRDANHRFPVNEADFVHPQYVAHSTFWTCFKRKSSVKSCPSLWVCVFFCGYAGTLFGVVLQETRRTSAFFLGGVPLKKTPTLPVHSSKFLVVVFGQAVSLARREREADQREAGDVTRRANSLDLAGTATISHFHLLKKTCYVPLL